MGTRRGRRRNERAAAAVEFALIAPLLLMLVFGIIDFGWMLMKANLVNNAARDAVRSASLSGSYETILASVNAELESAGIDDDDVTVEITCTNTVGSNCTGSAASYNANATTGSAVRVKITYTHNWLTPLGATCALLGNESCVGDSIVLERTAAMVRE
jgi:Flp pilus assembly protein TadG